MDSPRAVLYTAFFVITIFVFAFGHEETTNFEQGQAPGVWRFMPNKLISGETTRLELRYIQGAGDLPAGAYHRLLIEPLSVKTLFHCPPSTDLEVVAGSMGSQIKIEPEPVHGVGFREVKIVFPDGFQAGESFSLIMGNKNEQGEVIALVNPIPVHNLTFETYTGLDESKAGTAPDKSAYKDPWGAPEFAEYDWQKMGWAYALPKVDIEAAKASALRIFAPSLIENNAKFDIRISVTDEFDSGAYPVYEGKVIIESAQGFENAPDEIVFSGKDNNSQVLKDMLIATPGIYRLKAKLDGSDKVFESNPVVVREEVKEPIHWGNLHNHGKYSECWGDSLDHFFSFARDISGMDWVSLSDHIGAVPRKQGGVGRLLRWREGKVVSSWDSWENMIDHANKYNSEKFVTLIGYEWSSMEKGHYNIYLADANMENMLSMFTPQYRDSGFDLIERLRKVNALFIPHKHADVFPYRSVVEPLNAAGEPLTPVIEVYSDWGDAFYPFGEWDPHSRFGGTRNELAHSYLWALENDYHLGVNGDSDSHTGLPGRRNPGGISPEHNHPQGLTAVITNDFTRQGIMNGFHDRSTYGTTGERIFLDVRAAAAKMGQTLIIDKPFDVEVETAGTDTIESVSLYNGLKLIEKKTGFVGKDVKVTFKAIRPEDTLRAYTVAVVQKDENRAYASPIWVRKEALPDLVWVRNDVGGIYLYNKGKATAEAVEVMLSETDHPFTAAEIKGRECGWDDTVGFIWTTPRSGSETIFHYRWHGEPISGNIKIEGARNYEFDYNRDFLFWQGKMNDHGDGTADFTIGKTHTKTHSIGFDIVVDVDPKMPSAITLEFDDTLTTMVGDDTIMGKQLSIPLNGRTATGKARVENVGDIAAGDRWELPDEYYKWYLSADPYNEIAESSENNNLLKVK